MAAKDCNPHNDPAMHELQQLAPDQRLRRALRTLAASLNVLI
jgi:hypothetical protein